MASTLNANYSTSHSTPAAAPGREEAAAVCVSDLAAASPRGWDSRTVREVVSGEYTSWISGLANWTTFITLTFREDKYPDVAKSLFQWFVRVNNTHAFGRHYTRKVKHSYFSYAVGLEYQRREVVHFHVLIDKPIDFSYVHATWGDRCGFAWIDTDLKDRSKVIGYVCKYVCKGGQIDVYKAQGDFSPAPRPQWWVGQPYDLSRVLQGALFSPGELAQPLTGPTTPNS